MSRFLSVSLLVSFALLAPSAAQAADDEPTLQGKTLSEWIVLLRGEKAKTDRHTLLLALGCSASHPEVWKGQIRLREVAILALEIIGPRKSPAVFPALLDALRTDPEESVRRGAADSLGHLGSKIHDDNLEKRGMTIKLDDVRDGLTAVLKNDKSPKVRAACARALGQLKEDANEAVPALVAAVKDPHEGIQAAAAESLRNIVYAFPKSLAIRDALPQLEDALKNPKTNTPARVQLAITMGIVAEEVNVKPLGDLLKDPATPDELRITIAETLGTIAETLGKLSKLRPLDSVAALKEVLAAKDGTTLELRRACVAALDKFGPDAKPALPELMKVMHDKDKFLRTSSMHAIGRIGIYLGSDSKAVVKDLLTICDETITEVRLAAIETLGNLGADAIGADLPAVVEKLNKLGKDSDSKVREAATNALKKLKPAP